MFVKLFETEVGQILVKIDDGEDGPEVRYYFEPEGLGVCSMALNFKDSDEGDAWDKADKAFALIDKDQAISLVKSLLVEISSKKFAQL